MVKMGKASCDNEAFYALHYRLIINFLKPFHFFEHDDLENDNYQHNQ